MSTPASATDLPRPPRLAATVVVVRDAPQGIEVLMLERADKGDRNSGAWVFPGGLLDAADRGLHACCAGMDDATASTRLGIAEGGLDFYVAAIREAFEEAGLLLARDANGEFPSSGALARLAPLRTAVARGEHDFGALCRDHGFQLAPGLLHYIAHRVTPEGLPKRFDTRFFLAVLPPGQQATSDASELLQEGWFRPTDLLRDTEGRKLLRVTRSILDLLAPFDTIDALMAWAASPREVPRIQNARPEPST